MRRSCRNYRVGKVFLPERIVGKYQMSIRTGLKRASILLSPLFVLGIASFVLNLFVHGTPDSPHFVTVLIGCILFALGAIAFIAVRAFRGTGMEERSRLKQARNAMTHNAATTNEEWQRRMEEKLKECEEAGMVYPFIACAISPNGSILATRLDGVARTEQLLAKHLEPDEFKGPMTIVMFDQKNNAVRIAIDVVDNIVRH